ncbi:4383_t:CDS:1, partial [Cetraspora pellucida]
WLRYMLLIKLFSPPTSSSQLISLDLILSIESFDGNEPIISSLVGKGDYKQDITLDNQNDNQDIHLVYPESVHLKNHSQYSSFDISSNYLNLSSSDPLICSSENNQINQTNISNRNNRNNINVIDISNRDVSDNELPKRILEELPKIFSSDFDLSQEFKLILKRL